ncbi:TetR/AcrR family transcriptional regulator [Streptomyces sp. LHD-70]|uniref:TetR/AcrR family transcriptional regulator n=1 Tax=Streptomyces sp. LHD-70 TaxID=3072140 RepID=UPI00280F5A68|nr:TetR/AcrR family transcriptional regulator [Streptomyces sp. LHD-70]MDQ8705204.1 TetR/AcrR family transcriptional regulator [Streptomyces sp. LHD-70]
MTDARQEPPEAPPNSPVPQAGSPVPQAGCRSEAPATRRPGGRTARVRAQVLEAVLAELGERGFAGLTVEGVAARAGVHRTTVYRRWQDVGGLLADALDAAGEDTTWQPPDTGSLHGDLHALNTEIYDSLRTPASVPAALIAASFHSDRAAHAQQRLWEGRYAQCGVIVERAVRRAELPPGTDARRLLIAATAPLYHELILLRTPARPQLPLEAAEMATAAANAGAFGPRRDAR